MCRGQFTDSFTITSITLMVVVTSSVWEIPQAKALQPTIDLDGNVLITRSNANESLSETFPLSLPPDTALEIIGTRGFGSVTVGRDEMGKIGLTTNVYTVIDDLAGTTTRGKATTTLSVTIDIESALHVSIDASELIGAPSFEFSYPNDIAKYAYYSGDGWADCNFPMHIPPEDLQFVSNSDCSSYATASYMQDWEDRFILGPVTYEFILTMESSSSGRYRIPLNGKSTASISVAPRCDVTGDGTCNVMDIDSLTQWYLTHEGDEMGSELYDLDDDGTVSVADRRRWIATLDRSARR